MNPNKSLWHHTSVIPSFARLTDARGADVVVVGGGISGVTAALLLQRAGKQVILLESRRLGAGETGYTTAHLTEILDTRYHVLESKFGGHQTHLVAQSSRLAIDKIESLVQEFGADSCGFGRVPGYLFAETDEQRAVLELEIDALQRVGAKASLVENIPLPFATIGAIRIDNQAQIHPLEYLAQLTRRLISSGGQIFEQTKMLDVEEGEPCRVHTDAGELRAAQVLVLTHVPVANRVAIHTKIAAYRSYAIAGKAPDPEFPPGLFWDLSDPYHYIRRQDMVDGRYVIIGGEDHKTGKKENTLESYRALEAYARTHFPGFEASVRWSGQIMEPVDGLPFIGRNTGSTHVYVATGFSGNGITYGTLAAMSLADAVLGIRSPWTDLYDATRVKPVAQSRQYLTENVDFPTHMVTDRFAKGDVKQYQEIPMGEGRLVREQGRMLAVYRDPRGTFHVRSAVCPHLGCHVRWNKAERSWDCPCHGSRFDIEGAVLNGPATTCLKAGPTFPT